MKMRSCGQKRRPGGYGEAIRGGNDPARQTTELILFRRKSQPIFGYPNMTQYQPTHNGDPVVFNGRTSQVVGLFGLGRSAIDTSLCC
jgi:hypothetical protein